MVETLNEMELTPADYRRMGAALKRGALLVLPSDTVYGLACLASHPGAVERIYEVKGRHFSKPLALVFTSVDGIEALAGDLPAAIARALPKLLPGPVTAIIPFEDGTGGVRIRGAGSAGVRIIPPPQGDLYRYLPGPLAVTSANLSGEPDPNKADEVTGQVLEACEFFVAGAAGSGVPSTVVDLRPLAAGGHPVILRQGSMSAGEIERRLVRP